MHKLQNCVPSHMKSVSKQYKGWLLAPPTGSAFFVLVVSSFQELIAFYPPRTLKYAWLDPLPNCI